MNSFSEIFIQNVNNVNDSIKKISVKTRTLSSILDEFLPKNIQIDLLSVDTEGYDLIVLKSNNWNKYIPKVIVTEFEMNSFKEIENNEITKFLNEKGYSIFSITYLDKNLSNVFFKYNF